MPTKKLPKGRWPAWDAFGGKQVFRQAATEREVVAGPSPAAAEQEVQ